MESGYWQDLKSVDLPVGDAQRTVGLLPVAAVEQHGPHLPLGTDAVINAGVVEAALHRVGDGARLLVLPALNVGDSLEHTAFAGTLSVESHTLLGVWLDVARGARRAGLRKLVLFNSHGGNAPLVDLAATRLRAERGMLVARVSVSRLGSPPGLFAAEELSHGLHGGEVETSLMLHLRPDLVDTGALADFRGLPARWAGRGRTLGVERPAGIGWMAQDLHRDGVCGNAAAADAARGGALLEHLAEGLVRVVHELAQTPLDVLREVDAGGAQSSPER